MVMIKLNALRIPVSRAAALKAAKSPANVNVTGSDLCSIGRTMVKVAVGGAGVGGAVGTNVRVFVGTGKSLDIEMLFVSEAVISGDLLKLFDTLADTLLDNDIDSVTVGSVLLPLNDFDTLIDIDCVFVGTVRVEVREIE